MKHLMVNNVHNKIPGDTFPVQDAIYPDCVSLSAVTSQRTLLYYLLCPTFAPTDGCSYSPSEILIIEIIEDLFQIMKSALCADYGLYDVSLHLFQTVLVNIDKFPDEGCPPFPCLNKIPNFSDNVIPGI